MQTHETSNLLYDLLTEPRFRFVRHLLLVSVLVCVAFGQSFFVFGNHREALGNNVYFFVATLTIVYIALAYFNLYYLAPRLLLKNKQLKNSITELKEHINPDFLFRIIGYASEEVKTNPEKVSGMLFKLSELLRYELYDCKRGKVILKSDIDFVNDYLLLEQQLRDSFTFNLSVTGQANRFIRPFVFMPFIQEIMKRDPAHLSILFKLEPDLTELECTITELASSNHEPTTLRLKYAE